MLLLNKQRNFLLKNACICKKFLYNGTRSLNAGIAQLVEHNLAMVRVADSSSVSRSSEESLLLFQIPKT